MNNDAKLDTLLVGQARTEVALAALSDKLGEHTEQDDMNFTSLHLRARETTASVQRLETAAEMHDVLAASSAKRANKRWTTAAIVAAVVSAGASLSQALM